MAIHSTYYMNWAAFDVPGVSIVDRTTHVVGLAHPDHPDVADPVTHR